MTPSAEEVAEAIWAMQREPISGTPEEMKKFEIRDIAREVTAYAEERVKEATIGLEEEIDVLNVRCEGKWPPYIMARAEALEEARRLCKCGALNDIV